MTMSRLKLLREKHQSGRATFNESITLSHYSLKSCALYTMTPYKKGNREDGGQLELEGLRFT